VHACPGNELAKLEMLILIHHLVTGYRCAPLLADPPYIPPCPCGPERRLGATPLATSGPAQNATTPHTTHAPNPPIRVHRSYHKPWVRPALSRARCRLLAQQTDNYPRPGCSYSYVSSVSTDHSCITTARRSCSEILTLVSCACSICRWEIVGSSDEVEYSPFPVPKHGLPVRLWRDNRTVDRKGVCESDDVEDIIV